MPVFYAVSNLGNTSDKNKTEAKRELTLTSTTSNAIREMNIKGTYPMYTNGESASNTSADSNFPTTNTATANIQLPLVDLNVSSVKVGCKYAAESTTGRRLLFEYPAIKHVSKVEFYSTVQKDWVDFTSSGLEKTISNKTINGSSIGYKQWTTNGDLSGAMQVRFTLINA